jgi:Predicted solute binding protein
VSTNRDLSNGEIFFFQVRNASNINDLNEIFASHYFNITEDASATVTTSSLAISTTQATTSTLSSSPSSTPSPAVATTTTASDNSQGNSGLSDGTKIGVGVGVGLGGAFVAALAVFAFVRRRSKSSMQVNESSPVTSQTQPMMDSKSYNGQAQNEAPKIFEAPANEARRLIELP